MHSYSYLKQWSLVFILFLTSAFQHCLISQHTKHQKSLEKASQAFPATQLVKVDHTQTSWYIEMQKENPNLINAEKYFIIYFKAYPHETSKQRKLFIRWLTTHRPNVDQDGYVIKSNVQSYQDMLGKHEQKALLKKSASSGSWRMIGPNNHLKTRCDGESSWMSGGYVDRVYINPYNTQNLIAGFSFGGLWVSQDQGDTWALTDGEFPNGTNTYANNDRYYGEIESCASNPSVVYAATEAGLLKSTNSGNDWNYCATLNRTVDVNNRPYYITVNPNNPNIITSTFGRRVYHSTTGGASWTLAFDNSNGGPNVNGRNQHVVSAFGLYERDYNFFGLEINYNNPNIVYLGLRNNNNEPCIYKSTNGGASFSLLINLNVVNNRIMPAHLELHTIVSSPSKFFITPRWETDDTMYTYDANGNLLKALQLNTNAQAVGISWTDENTIYNGKYLGEHLYKSTNGGPNFTDMMTINPNSCKSVHADVRDIDVNGNLVLIATDGGMSISKDGGVSIRTIGHEISAADLWGFSSSLRSEICIASMDHGPTSIRRFVGDEGWIDRGGADALHATVSQSHDRWVYYNRNYGGRFKEYVNPDGTLSNRTAVAPPFTLDILEFHPNIYNIIYGIDDRTLYRTVDNFSSDEGYETIFTFNKTIRKFRIAKDNPKIMYVLLSNNEIRKSINSGANWTNITPGIGVNYLGLTIGETADDLFVSLGNSNSAIKVIKSINGGNSWQNWTTPNLPAQATAAITHQIGTDGGVYMAYIGMDGVWYRNNQMSQWEELGNGLPMLGYLNNDNIYAVPNQGVCRMGSARGAWEHDLYEASDLVANFSVETNQVRCSNQIVSFIDNSSTAPIAVNYSWSFPGGSPSSSSSQYPAVVYSNPGTYDVTLTITDGSGNSDTHTLTDFIEVTTECDNGILSPYENGFKCNNNNIAESTWISGQQELLIHDFTTESGTEFLVDLNVITNCYNKTANLQALIDVEFDKINVSTYNHFDRVTQSPISGDGTAKVTSFESSFAEISFEIRNKQLFLSMLSNPCGSAGRVKLNPSCVFDACQNTIPQGTLISGGTEVEIVDFAGSSGDLFYLSLHSYVNCYSKSSKALTVVDISEQTINVLDYFHFDSETSSAIEGDGTNNITSTSAAYGKISYSLNGTKLYFTLISNACGSTGRIETSCWRELGNLCLDIIDQSGANIITNDQHANQIINTDGIVPNGANISYTAGDYIVLKPPSFEVTLGALFEAKIGPCQ